MKRVVASVFGFIYQRVIKYGIFAMHPDVAHSGTIRFAEIVSRVSWVRWLIRLCFKPRSHRMLSQELMGLRFVEPVGLSAGFDKNAEAVGVTSNLGFGFGTVGSVTAEVCEGNPKPWFYRLKQSKSLVVYVGLANQGVKRILARLTNERRRIDSNHHIVLSIAKTNIQCVVSEQEGIDDYMASYKLAVKNPVVRMIEINISCPNTYGGEPFTKPKALKNLLDALLKIPSKKPVTLKLPSDLEWQAVKALIDVAEKYPFVKALTVANLAKDRSKVVLKDVLPDDVQGNLSGEPVRELSNNLLKHLRLEYKKRFVLIGVGGIMSSYDAYEKIRYGADLVELISGMIYTGPQLPTEIHYGLIKYLKRDGFSHISEAVGVDARLK